jgi:hypothetical protein
MKNLYKRPLASFLKIIAIGAVIVMASALAGCDTSDGCKGDGACYYIRGSSDYKWCDVESCNVYMTTDTGQDTISCNCK